MWSWIVASLQRWEASHSKEKPPFSRLPVKMLRVVDALQTFFIENDWELSESEPQ